MKKRTTQFLLLLLAFMFSQTVAMAGDKNYFSKVTVTTTMPQAGKVYAAYNGGEYKEGSAESGKVTQKDAPTHTYKIKAVPNNGYSFVKWNDDNTSAERNDIQVTAAEDVAAATLAFTATFQILTYTITLNPGEGRVEWTEKEYNVETETFALPVPSHSDASYQFVGWYEDPQFEGARVNSVPKGTFGNKTYYAKYDLTLTPQITGDNVNLEIGQTKNAGFSFINVSNPIPAAESDGTNFYYTIVHELGEEPLFDSKVIAYDPETNLITAKNVGTATITFTQNATDVYEGVSKSFTIKVMRHSEVTGYVLYDIEGGSQFTGGTSSAMELSGPADKFTYTASFTSGAVNKNITPQYSVDGNNWTSLPGVSSNGDYGPYDLSQTGAKYIRFKTTGSLSQYYSNIKVTRLCYLNANDVDITKTEDGKFIIEGESVSKVLTVDWSVVSGGDLHIECDNSKFTLSQQKIAVVEGGADAKTDITVTYLSDEASEDEGNIIIYNDVYYKKVTVRGKSYHVIGIVTPNDGHFFSFAATESFLLPEGIEAYTGTLEGSKINLEALPEGSIIAGGQGIVFKGTVGQEYKFLAVEGEAVSQTNEFEGASNEITPDHTNYDYYVLGYAKNKPKGFYKYSASKNIPANKAFIRTVKSASAPSYLSLGDEETGIDEVNESTSQQADEIYNLSGQRIQHMQRGINIVGGKKVLK